MRKLIASGAGVGILVVAGLLSHSTNSRAQQQSTDPELQKKIQTGFQTAPVPLNTQGQDPAQVGYGSYLVGALGCNDCHGGDPSGQYTSNPFFGKPTVINPATYLGGGRDFGAFPDPAGPFPHIISRNLTPDSTGLPIGGDSYTKFLQVMRTGVDPDHVHPTCKGAPDGTCLPAPFNGDLLQIMPWPGFQNLTDRDLQAIYAYLSTIPCLEGGPGEPANRCGKASPSAKTRASAKPKYSTVTVSGQSLQLDGSGSTSGDGKPLQYSWTIAPGSLAVPIFGSNTATPTVLFGAARGTYTFQLTVTDSTGNTSTDFATVNYSGN